MSATGLPVFDETVQLSNVWLNEIMDDLGPDRQRALHALRAVLHALRDRLVVDETAHLGAQLPMLIRGVYYENWRPTENPSRERSRDEFVAKVADGLKNIQPVGPDDAIRAVFKTMLHHLDPGEIQHVKHMLPQDIRALWPETAH